MEIITPISFVLLHDMHYVKLTACVSRVKEVFFGTYIFFHNKKIQRI